MIVDGRGWVDQLAVAREHRGRGLARALLQHAFGETWRAGCAGPGCRRIRARARAGSTSTSGCTSARRTPSSRSRSEMRDTSAAMAATHAKRLLLLALMALAAVNLFTGAPLLADLGRGRRSRARRAGSR